MPPKVTPAGDRALLVDLGDVTASELHAAAARVSASDNILACITGHSSLYVIFRGKPDLQWSWSSTRLATPVRHDIEVSFADEYGLDLAEFLARTAVTPDAFLQRVASLTLSARYLGFRAGFAYLEGWPAEWSMPRRPTSRARVAAGSFAIAGAMSGFYPIDSPGGWNILGRTSIALANRFAPGDEIAIRPTLALLDDGVPPAPPLLANAPTLPKGIEVLANRQFITMVTRPDYAGLERGRPPGGPFDENAARLANETVGNGDDTPLLECALVGPRLRFHEPCVVAWQGADSDLPKGELIVVEAGQELSVGRIRNGLRGYLAFGESGEADRADFHHPPGGRLEAGPTRRLEIRVGRGPHDSPVGTIECEVTPQLDRVGIRMRPLQPLGITAPADMPSYGMQFGTIQLHPDGTLVAMGPDHPITGGYLQPLTVLWSERWKLGQLTPGDRVTLLAV
jgi:KipI family sensor histidine kinase inhibitor